MGLAKSILHRVSMQCMSWPYTVAYVVWPTAYSLQCMPYKLYSDYSDYTILRESDVTML